MKNLLLVCLLLSITFFTFAQSISFSEAKIVAENTITERLTKLDNNSIYKIDNYYTESFQDTDVFYVFNLEPQGFIIISATKATQPILAFSNESEINEQNRHSSIDWWLNNYSIQIQYLIENKTPATDKFLQEWDRLLLDASTFKANKEITSVSPLLHTKWNQGRYYNAHCPIDTEGTDGRVVVGCVATALGQLMNYFQHPNSGTGSYGYNHADYGWIEVNFAEQSYDYDQMPIEPTDYNDNLARLLYNIGVSVDMNYGPNGSGMWNHKGAYTLHTYFDYSPTCEYLFKDSLAEDFDWNGTLVNHLNQKIPLYYAGWSDYDFISGHAFILDGYSDSTHYHINWGWCGSSDGYFLISNLSPGGSDFTLLHEVIINGAPNSPAQHCTGHKDLTSYEGIISDGSGPLENYQNNTECTWLISPQDSVSGIRFEFLKLVMDNEDYIIIYDGDSDASPILETVYGDTDILEFESSAENVFIKFVSNSDSVNDGWLLAYNGIKPVYCTLMQTLTDDTNTITDGSNGYLYQNATFCNWNIEPENTESIRVTFTEFDIEPINDYVKILNSSNQTVANFSGSEIPNPILIMGEKITITFRSDNATRHQGFSLYYEINKDDITNLTSDNLNIYPNPVNDILNLDFNKQFSNLNIQVLDYTGKVILEKRISSSTNQNKTSINVSQLSAGVYFVNLISKNSILRYKFIKE